jgi:phage terminase large subunit-like protein
MPLKRVVVGVGPPASAGGDACGIVVCGLRADGIAYVLEDRRVGGLSPDGYEGPGRSPDRADAIVWAMAELLLGKARTPRVRGL